MFTVLAKNDDISFQSFNYKGTVKIKNIKYKDGQYTATVKVTSLTRIFREYPRDENHRIIPGQTPTERYDNATYVSSSAVRRVNYEVRNVVFSSLSSQAGIFSIPRWEIKVTTIDYKSLQKK